MAKNNKVAGAILGITFAAALYMSFSFPSQSAYFPRIICVLGLLLSALLIVMGFIEDKKPQNHEAKKLSAKSKKMIIIVGSLIALYAAAISTVGFAVSTFVYIVVNGWILCPETISKENKKPAIIIVASALIVTIAITFVFKFLLYVPLPTGILI